VTDRFAFECRLECETEPKIEWFKDGREVPRDRQTYREGLCQLIIDHTGPDDSAQYTCRATTEAGTTDTSATLRVKGSLE